MAWIGYLDVSDLLPIPAVRFGDLGHTQQDYQGLEPLPSFHVHRRASYVAYRVGGRLPACMNDDIDIGGEVRFMNEQEALPNT